MDSKQRVIGLPIKAKVAGKWTPVGLEVTSAKGWTAGKNGVWFNKGFMASPNQGEFDSISDAIEAAKEMFE